MIPACPVCEKLTLVRFECARDHDGNVTDILQCRSCLALLNDRAHECLKQKNLQDIQFTDYYAPEVTTHAQETSRLEEKARILDYLYGHVKKPYETLTFCDFGAGPGYVAMAAARRFKRSFVCEFDTRAAERACRILGRPDNLHIIRSLDELPGPVDVMCMWHVLEHIPWPLAFFEANRSRFAPGCVFFVQCPGYRPNAVVDCHYTFFNEPSIRCLFEKVGAKEIEIGFDIHNGFIGYLGQLAC